MCQGDKSVLLIHNYGATVDIMQSDVTTLSLTDGTAGSILGHDARKMTFPPTFIALGLQTAGR